MVRPESLPPYQLIKRVQAGVDVVADGAEFGRLLLALLPVISFSEYTKIGYF